MNKKSFISAKAQKVHDICEWLGAHNNLEYRYYLQKQKLILGLKREFDLIDLKMAGIAAKQHDLVVVLENNGYVWLGDYETVKQAIGSTDFHHIEKVC